jgi:murein DD-endopeptidase MepM/ murein hydrolase activator NlpD
VRAALRLGLVLLAVVAGPAFAAGDGPRFALPLDCQIGARCTVQNYLDHAPGPGAKDQSCGPLTYDGHRGIDIRVPGLRDMAAGVAVLAAAPGVVLRLRDGEPDISFRERGEDAVRGREAGNSVIVDHGGGWVSQYSHMRNGSIAVKPGQRVEAGTRLGLIGLSGRSEFPHLHFGVTWNDQVRDPFTGRAPESGCGPSETSLWTAGAQAALAYQAGGLLDVGFTSGPLDLDTALGATLPPVPEPKSPALVFWAAAWGLRTGDREEIRVIGPDGKVLAEWSGELPRNKAQTLRYAGRKRRGAAWPPGTYRGEYRVTRQEDGRAIMVAMGVRAFTLP